MCTVIVAWRVFDHHPLVLAANRDESLARPSDSPRLLTEEPPRWGGRDQLAGGTWLAVDPAGRVGAVTNRHPGGRVPARDADRLSRGSLPLDVLAGSDAEARAWAEALDPRTYNPVNIVYASRDVAFVTSMDDQGRHTTDLEPGVHVLTEQDIDDPDDVKTKTILERARKLCAGAADAGQAASALRELLRTHGEQAVCIHHEVYGTVSSSTVLISAAGKVRYEHAEGKPCVTPFDRVL